MTDQPHGADPAAHGRPEGVPHPDTATGPSGDPLAEAVDAASAGDGAAPGDTDGGAAGDGQAVADPGAPAGALDAARDGDELDELVAAHDRIAGLTGDLQRLQAEYVNYKRRVDRDRETNKQQATVTAATALLPVLDDIDRAREHGEVVGGFKVVADSLMRVVGQLGLERFGEPGEVFDPTLHEAISQRTAEDVETTTVEHVAQAGYKAGDRVVRAAMVVVVSPG